MRKQGLDEGPLDSLMENVVEDHPGKAGFLMVLQEGAKMLLSRIKTSTTTPRVTRSINRALKRRHTLS